MTRLQTLGAALATLLIPFLADSTASAQEWPCYWPVCGPVRYYYQQIPTQVAGCYPRSGTPYNSSNAFCSGPVAPFYGGDVRSAGMPLVQQQVAAGLALENSLRAVEVYFQRRLLNEAYCRQVKVARIRARLESQKQIHSMKTEYADTIEMNRQQLEKLAHQYAPKRLTPSEYSRLSGTVCWPLPFQEYPRFAGDRARIDALFAERTPYNSGVLSRNCVEVREAVERMKSTLRSMLGELDPTTYVLAESFLTRLAYEAKFPAEPRLEQVAAK
jgi:hypothetical protein